MTTLDELEAIRARHTQAEVRGGDTWDSGHVEWVWSDAHADRATLLRLLDAAQEELASVRQIAEPWLMWANELDDDRPDDDVVSSLIEAGHYRRLAEALKAPPTRAQGESS